MRLIMTFIKQGATLAKLPLSVSFANLFITSTIDRYKATQRLFQLECKKDVVDICKMEKCFAEMIEMLEIALQSYQRVTNLVAEDDLIRVGE